MALKRNLEFQRMSVLDLFYNVSGKLFERDRKEQKVEDGRKNITQSDGDLDL